MSASQPSAWQRRKDDFLGMNALVCLMALLIGIFTFPLMLDGVTDGDITAAWLAPYVGAQAAPWVYLLVGTPLIAYACGWLVMFALLLTVAFETD